MAIIACLHTADSNFGVYDRAARAMPGVVLRHAAHPHLLADAVAAGGLTAGIAGQAASILVALSVGVDAVLLTCSTLGPAIAGLDAPVPVVRADGALAYEAAERGGRVVVLCALETTMAPTGAAFAAAAAETGAVVDLRLVAGAWDLFMAGDTDAYLAMVAAAANEAIKGGADRVALAQSSMDGAAALCHGPVLTSPGAGLRAAMAASASCPTP